MVTYPLNFLSDEGCEITVHTIKWVDEVADDIAQEVARIIDRCFKNQELLLKNRSFPFDHLILGGVTPPFFCSKRGID